MIGKNVITIIIVMLCCYIGYEKGPFSEDRVDQFLGEMKKKYQTVIDNTKRQRVRKLFCINGVGDLRLKV